MIARPSNAGARTTSDAGSGASVIVALEAKAAIPIGARGGAVGPDALDINWTATLWISGAATARLPLPGCGAEDWMLPTDKEYSEVASPIVVALSGMAVRMALARTPVL